ncbi:MAG: efflux RND transporter permease subunit [Burkholderiaceae bacterium]
MRAGRFPWPSFWWCRWGVLGVLLATLLRGAMPMMYFQVGLVTVIGLSAKNAILIVDCQDLQAQGKSADRVALAAAHLRFRPIVMTSMAFMLGVLPLACPGAGSASQRAIGTGVINGMITGTVLARVPVFFRAGARPVQGQCAAAAIRCGACTPDRRGRPPCHKIQAILCPARRYLAALVLAGCASMAPVCRPSPRLWHRGRPLAPRPRRRLHRRAGALADFVTDARLRALIDKALADNYRPARAGGLVHRAGACAAQIRSADQDLPSTGCHG